MIQRRAERHDAIGRELAAASASSPTSPHAADGMRIDPPVSVPIEAKHMPSAIDCRRSAGRSARRSGGIERMSGGSERRLLVGRAERELVQIGLADEDRAGRRAAPRRRVHRAAT